MTKLKAGDKAPNFKSQDENGNPVSLGDFKGKKLILYFYPADNTPTCTVEACNLRDNFEVLRKAGYHVLGVSPDSEKKHQNFIKKHSLPFPLLVDDDLTMIKAYGVWGPKKTFGKEYDGLLRTTFIINEKSIIERVIDKVESKRHSEQILEKV
ncbi:MAG: thioredoxin-dependent thiol peroxidase [Saprospiraceae bacterium]|nr:thioredoxin-dependent thiol peroxidase [Saprospiraceae bacterium]MCF8249114.1 thioredoxin-dependent thiol peroxidase [Saprospiraceae bacterium]MCF8281371.1 thioredoxin-dependent thiol peroxidase [Bacteroidales bacterium]MCF8311136.1 thioredoxin-dependent thiol peroxidase [Saprospiraceae bacterium]MCF8440226.1 thioredoxin-dependent thiol peroxidase [Saprospiraceae bacterium]